MNRYGIAIAVLVVVILGYVLYSAVSVSAPSPEARDKQRMHDLKQVHTLLGAYYELNDRYPANLYDIRETPKGPGGIPYTYELLETGRDFQACAIMEDKSKYCITKSQFE